MFLNVEEVLEAFEFLALCFSPLAIPITKKTILVKLQ